MVFLSFRFVILSFFSSRGWESWDIANRPLIPERMPVLVDDDLLFEDGPAAPRPAAVVNRWLRELPASGCPSPGSWESYARVLKEWAEFLSGHGVGLFDSRDQLKLALGKYAGYRAAGPAERRFAATTWGRHMSVLSLFYRWAMDEGHAQAEPFTYRTARALFAGTGREVRVNLAVRRTPKPHVTIKYLEPDFTRLFLDGLRGLAPDGGPDPYYRGRELARNAAVGELALATGMRLQEFSSLLAWEIPPLPSRPVQAPIPFPVPSGIAKGRKFRTTWISYDALAAVHRYLDLDRPATVDGTGWRPPPRWGEPLLVTEPGRAGRQGQRGPPAVGDAHAGRAPPAGRPGRRDVHPRGAERRRPVHRLGIGVRAHRRPDPGPVRAPVPACLPAPAPAQFFHPDSGIPGQRPLPAGRPGGEGHRSRGRPGCGADALPDQGRPAARPA